MTIASALHPGERGTGLAVLAFKVQALQFDLNRDLKYISMKDQVIRGRTLILGAAHAGLISSGPLDPATTSNVLIIGGGIGGISAALTACELGMSARVIESADECFPLLGLGSDRLFSATVYDWPHAHSTKHEFPFVLPLRDQDTIDKLKAHAAVLRFPNEPLTAAALRKALLKQLNAYKSAYGHQLDILCGHRLGGADDVYVNEASKWVNVDINQGANHKSFRTQIVVFAAGFGLDKREEQTAAAKEFFSYADLDKDLKTAQSGNGIVQIWGSGDGGLQESLRFVLDGAWHDLGKVISSLENLLHTAGHSDSWSRLRSRIQSAEEQSVRALMWGYNEDIVFAEMDKIYETEIEQLLVDAPLVIDAWRKAVVRSTSITLEIVDDCAFSKKVYPLNRFLVRVLSRSSKATGTRVLRTTRDAAHADPAVKLARFGFASIEKQAQIGTADADDLLRRISFQGIPMNLDPVV